MKPGYKKRLLMLGLLLTAMIGSSAGSCDNKYTEPFKDAPRSGNDHGGAMDVITMSDGFNNIGFKCVGKDGVYDVYHGDKAYAGVFVVPNDPNCIGR